MFYHFKYNVGLFILKFAADAMIHRRGGSECADLLIVFLSIYD